MNILIRLPNWLGDMVMSTAFVQAVQQQYPHAQVDLVAKKGIDFLLDYFLPHGQRYIFSREAYPGITGARRFGKMIRTQKRYDIFFCLPDSFSSAIMAHATGAAKRVGFKKELRSVFMTDTFTKQKNLHRVEEYVNLLQQYAQTNVTIPAVQLVSIAATKGNALVININSEAVSRRLPVPKAISIINAVRQKITNEIILVGSNKEAAFVDEVYQALPDKTNITNRAGQTSLPELLELFGSAAAVLSTDSGPAHVANALGTFTVVLFGAGNENNTAPYNKDNRAIIRLGQLPCEPCVSNTCKVYGVPECLVRLDEQLIVVAVEQALH